MDETADASGCIEREGVGRKGDVSSLIPDLAADVKELDVDTLVIVL